jgi:hypothetical protein
MNSILVDRKEYKPACFEINHEQRRDTLTRVGPRDHPRGGQKDNKARFPRANSIRSGIVLVQTDGLGRGQPTTP